METAIYKSLALYCLMSRVYRYICLENIFNTINLWPILSLNVYEHEIDPQKVKPELLFLFFFATFSLTCLMCTCEAPSHVWISSVALSGSVSPPPPTKSHYTPTVSANHWRCMYPVIQSHIQPHALTPSWYNVVYWTWTKYAS